MVISGGLAGCIMWATVRKYQLICLDRFALLLFVADRSYAELIKIIQTIRAQVLSR